MGGQQSGGGGGGSADGEGSPSSSRSWCGVTGREQQALRQAWRLLLDRHGIDTGAQLFLRFFEQYPVHKDYFSAFRDTPVSQLAGSRILRAHGAMVVHTLSTIIDKLDDYPSFRAALSTGVAAHHKRGVQLHSYRDMFSVCGQFLEDKLGPALDASSRAAWRKVATAILDVVADVMLEQVAKHGHETVVITRHTASGENNGNVVDYQRHGYVVNRRQAQVVRRASNGNVPRWEEHGGMDRIWESSEVRDSDSDTETEEQGRGGQSTRNTLPRANGYRGSLR